MTTSTSVAHSTLTNEDILSIATICNNVCYWLHLQLHSKATGIIVEIPEEVSELIELAKRLPMPEPINWARLAKGKVDQIQQSAKKSASRKGKTDATLTPATVNGSLEALEGEGTDKKRKRQAWTEENRNELVRLVDDEAHRQETLGKSALNWASIARHLGFSAGPAVHRQYNVLKGIELPSAAKSAKPNEPHQAGGSTRTEEETAAEDAASPTKGGKSAKKAKKDMVGAKESSGPSVDGWSKAQLEELVKLVKDESYRKEVLGKKKLKWQRLADHFSKAKKDARLAYTAVTGEAIE